jgi:hypothetical protein
MHQADVQAVVASMDRKDRERELVSQLLVRLHPEVGLLAAQIMAQLMPHLSAIHETSYRTGIMSVWNVRVECLTDQDFVSMRHAPPKRPEE